MTDEIHQFVHTMRVAALQAGAVARRLQGQVEHGKKAAPGGSPESEALTAVDLATQDVVLYLLADALPDVAVDAEEDTETVRLFPPAGPDRSEVVLDPVDGTLSYLLGSMDYAVMGALIQGGRFAASVAAFPAHGELLWAVAGEGCYAQPERARPERVRVTESTPHVLVSPKTPERWQAALRDAGYEVAMSRCSAVDSAAPALGRGCAVYGGRPDRRRALPFLLTLEAGGAVLFGDRVWAGEDPHTWDDETDCTVAADTEDRARHLLRVIRGS